MKYVLLIPLGSLKHQKQIIRLLGGFWNGIGYAFPFEKKEWVINSFGSKEVRNMLEVEWDGSWDKYREFCREDYEYTQLINLKIERHCLQIMENENDCRRDPEEKSDTGCIDCRERGQNE